MKGSIGGLHMYIINSNFTLMKQIGDLSESRIEGLRQAFNEYPEVIRPNEHVIVFRKGTTALIVQPDQITCLVQGEVTEINVDNIVTQLLKANEVLGLSNRALVTTRFEATENTLDNIMEKSKVPVEASASELGASGVGYRFIINNSRYRGDLNVEPYIKDNQKIFYNVTLQSLDTVEVEQAPSLLEEMFSFGSEKAKQASRHLFLQ